MIIRGGHHGEGAAPLVGVDPAVGDVVQMIDQRAGDDAAVGLIGVECPRIPGPQLQRRRGFPAMREPVQSFELLDPTIHTQLGQQTAPAHTLQLARIADQRQPPPVALSQRDDAVEGGRGEHAGFVHDQGRPGRQPELRQRWPVTPVPFVQQLGDGVCRDAGITLQGPCCFRCRRHREHHPTVRMQILGGSDERARLAGTSWADNQHEPIVTGQGGAGVALQHIQTVPVDRGGRCRRVGLGGHRPREDRLLLHQHRVRREPGCGRFDPHRPPVRFPPGRFAGRVKVDQRAEHPVSRPLQRLGPAVTRRLRHGTLPITDRLQHIGPRPRRPLLRHRLDHLRHRHDARWQRLRRGLVDGGGEQVGAPADGGGLGLPPCRQIGVRRDRTCVTVYRPTPHGTALPAPIATAPDPRGCGTPPACLRARRRCRHCASRTRRAARQGRRRSQPARSRSAASRHRVGG